MLAIKTQDLRKRYRTVQALKGVSLAVEPGTIYGLLGQNGAGKTTLVKILLGITKPTGGEAQMLGEPTGAVAVRRRVGYLPEDHRFPDYHTGYSLLDFYGGLMSCPRRERRRRVPQLLGMVGLSGRMHSKIRTYSKGMKQRLGIAQALIQDPDLIFLDEPTDGVDPLGRRAIRSLMQQLKDQGKTIFLNSHLLGEVELICDRVGILQLGKLIREGDVASLTRQRGLFVIGLAPEQAFPRAEVEALGHAVRPSGGRWEVELPDGRDIDPVVDLLRARGLSLRHLEEKHQTLEQTFLETVTAAEPGVDAPDEDGAAE